SWEAESFHGTLMAIWVWARHDTLAHSQRFEHSRELGWSFVLQAAARHLPDSLDEGDYESPFDAACLLHAALADREAGSNDARQGLATLAAGALASHVEGLPVVERGARAGREFRDPGFLAWQLAEWARLAQDRRALAAATACVERC